MAGQDALLTVLNILLALMAGLLFGNLLLPRADANLWSQRPMERLLRSE